MRNWFDKHLDLIIINLITLIFALLLFIYVSEKIEVIGAVIATGISLSFGVRQYQIENDKMFKELFENFNKRYDCKFNDRFNKIDELIKSDENFTLNGETDRLLIIDYLNFCSEEYLWYSKGRIPETVWNAWENGMLYFLNLKPINSIVQTQKGQKSSYYGLFDRLANKLTNSSLIK